MNDDFAAETIALAVCGGYCSARFVAPENDLVKAASVLSLTLPASGDAAISLVNAEAYPAVNNAPKIDCMMAPPKSRWRSAVPDAIPARVTGTDPVSECDAGVPAKPTPIPTNE